MSEKGEVEQAWERAIKTIPVVRGRRKVKVVAADGSVREADAADVLASLIEREGLETVVREGVLPVEIQRRRAAGLPDLCVTCGVDLPMGRTAAYKRTLKDHSRWTCKPCTARHVIASRTPEQRREAARKAAASMTPEQRSAAMRKAWHSQSDESRAAFAARGREFMKSERFLQMKAKRDSERTPEQFSERSRKSSASQTSEQRAERGRKAAATRLKTQPHEDRSESVRKGHATRRAKKAEAT